MIIYRPHRGLLADALAEAQEFETEDEMKQYIYEREKKFAEDMGFKKPLFDSDDIVIDHDWTVDDSRCG